MRWLAALAMCCALLGTSSPRAEQVQSTGQTPDSSAAAASKPASQESIAKLKQNPVSGLRQVIADVNVSPNAGGSGLTEGAYSLQVVWPFPLTKDLRLVSYTILPTFQLPNEQGTGTEYGLGDTLINVFVAPRKPSPLVWGLGPSIMLPTRTDADLGSNRLGLGPSGLVYYARGAWSAGAVVQNVWSLGGTGINEVNEFGLQYIFNYNLPQNWYLFSNATITADWTAASGDIWTVPVGGGAGKVFNIGKQPVSLTVQGFWNAYTPRGGATWVLNTEFSLLFP